MHYYARHKIIYKVIHKASPFHLEFKVDVVVGGGSAAYPNDLARSLAPVARNERYSRIFYEG